MRVLVVGAGGVGSAVARIAARRDFFDSILVADYDLGRARRAVDGVAEASGERDGRFAPARVDASSATDVR